jgi:hypothetical protein
MTVSWSSPAAAGRASARARCLECRWRFGLLGILVGLALSCPMDLHAQQSDTFEAPLDPSVWTFVDPRGDTQLEVVDAGTGTGALVISVPAGVLHDAPRADAGPRADA